MNHFIKCPKCSFVQTAQLPPDDLSRVQGKKTHVCNQCSWVITEADWKRVWPLPEAEAIAFNIVETMTPHCEGILIAGSIRRRSYFVGDIEILCIPKQVPSLSLLDDGGLMRLGSWGESVMNIGHKIKGKVHHGKYIQMLHPSGIKVDIFTTNPDSWGYQLAVRTGSAEFSKGLAFIWKSKGFHGKDGSLWERETKVKVRSEEHLFHIIGVEYIEPSLRTDAHAIIQHHYSRK